jgi:hypothetical protein
MGMFDTVRSSYDLGPGWLNKELQTKDLDCCMAEYWISPAGQLFELDYSGTHDFEETPIENKPTRFPLTGFKWVPNGNRGKVHPVFAFKVVELYPAKWDAHYAKWPSCHVHFWDGMIKEVRHATLHDVKW